MTNPDELERAAGNLAGLARDLERYDPWGGTRSRSDAADLRLILSANREMRKALETISKGGPVTAVPAEQAAPPVLPGNHFIRGAQACREMMARFVETTHPEIATSIRLNWHPGWGEDPGKPPAVIDTWEPELCPEGEAKYAALRADDPDIELDLELTARMLETWGPVVEPAYPNGQITFTRGLMASAAEMIRAQLGQSVGTTECGACWGSGKIVEEACTTGANQHSACQHDCDDCAGTGRVPATPPAADTQVGIAAGDEPKNIPANGDSQ